MNFKKMIEAQENLDIRITKKKNLEHEDNTRWKILALQVELGELANEWRGFKKWSNDQTPRTSCPLCKGSKEEELGEGEWDACSYCEGEDKNPLLEEFADCVSFYLSIAIEKGWTKNLYLSSVHQILDFEETGFDGGPVGALIEVFYWLNKSSMEGDEDKKIERTFGISKQEFCFRNSWIIFLAIGVVEFKFTLNEVEDAYFKKNKMNHDRQTVGY